ncbi:MAG: leucine-rich repeat protein [Oscillospiraceae bacterium]|nr:leucine-rich repeat protein [Oscillospiraceae bacterium]
MKKMRKALAILLCLVICVTMLPTWAMGEDAEAVEPFSEEPAAEMLREEPADNWQESGEEPEPEEVVQAAYEYEQAEPSVEEPEYDPVEDALPPQEEIWVEETVISEAENEETGTEVFEPLALESEIKQEEIELTEGSAEPQEETATQNVASDQNGTNGELAVVIFRLTPENAELVLFIQNEYNEKQKIDAEEDGSYLLLPGEYFYSLNAEGYTAIKEERLEIEASEEPVEIELVMMPTEEEIMLLVEETETENEETADLMAASGICGDNLTWTLDDSGTLTISGTGAMISYQQGSNVTTAPWGANINKVIIDAGITSIGSYAFYGCSSLASVDIPDTVTSIGSYAFELCKKLTVIDIPESVTSIGSAVFENCKGIAEFKIPRSVASIGSSAFSQCTGLKRVEFAGSPGDVKSSIFSGCNNLESLRMPIIGPSLNTFFSTNSGSVPTSLKSVEIIEGTTVPANYFSACSGITSIVLPDSITSIGAYAFSGCTGISSLMVPSGVTSIGNGAFSNCSSLTKLIIPDSVITIGETNGGAVFSGCTEIKTAGPIGSGSNYEYGWTNGIISKAFYGCDQLVRITFPAGITSIGSYAFYGCSSLASVDIPDTVTSIGSYAFEQCKSLAEIVIPESVTSIGTAAFDNCKGITEFKIPRSVASIGFSAFSQCTGLKRVEFAGRPGDVKSSILSGCNNLESLRMPIIGSTLNTLFSTSSGSVPTSLKSVEITEGTTVPANYFSACSGITSIMLPNSITSIEAYAFSGCRGISSLTIPSGVTSIGDGAFSNCSSLSTVCLYSSIDGNKIGTGASSGSPITDIYYPFETVSDSVKTAFPSDAVWHLSSMGRGGDGIGWYLSVSTGTLTFSGSGEMDSFTEERPWDVYRAVIRNVVIGDGITAIGRSSFSGYPNLISVELPLSITAVGAGAFGGCSSLTDVYYLDGSQVYRDRITVNEENEPFENAVWHCMNYVGDGSCGDLIWIIMDDGTMLLRGSGQMPDFSMNEPAPWHEYKNIITAVQVNEQISRIGDYAFAGLSQMPRFTIPGSITELGTAIFYGSNVGEVVFSDNMPDLADNVFLGANLTALYPGESDTYAETDMLSYGGNVTWVAYFNGNPEENYYVSFNGNEGENAPERQVKYYAADLQLCPDEPVRTGYDFLGWAEQADAEKAEYQPQEFVSKNGDLTLYAVWKLKVFSVEFDANGGTNAPENQTKTYGAELVLPAAVPVREGYDFVGWATSKTAISAQYLPGDLYTADNDILLYAVWKIRTFTVVFDANGGSGAPVPQTKTYGKALTLSRTVPVFTGHSFQGWDTSPEAVRVVYGPGGTYTANDHASLYAVWKKERYSLNYDANGGQGTPGSVTAEYQTVLQISTSVPTRDFYDFLGWATSKDASTAQYQAGDPYVLEKTQTLYAVWEKHAVNSGTCGESMTWTQYSDGELFLTGTGTMKKYETGSKPWNCENVYKVRIGNSVTDIGGNQFSDCSNLTAFFVEAENTAYSVTDEVLYSKNQKILISCPPGKKGTVQVLNATTEIAADAFLGCGAITAISLPAGLKTIGDTAFCRCESLTSIELPNTVISIGGGAFSRCKKLENITLPENLTVINFAICYGCSALQNIALPTRLTTIKESAFFDCDTLTEVTIPATVSSIETNAFGGCDSLRRIDVAQGNQAFASDSLGILYNRSITTLLQAPCGIIGHVDIPESVTKIGETGFYLCSKLGSIRLSAHVKTIEKYAFSGCSALTDVYRDVPTWKAEKEPLYISSNNEPLKNATWHYLENIDEGTCGDHLHWFVDADKALVIQGSGDIPDFSDASSPWYAYRNDITSIVLPDGLTQVGSYAFQGCTKMKGIDFPKDIKSIGDYAFADCVALSAVNLPDHLNSIGNGAFSGCVGITRIKISSNVQVIGKGALEKRQTLTIVCDPETEAFRYALKNAIPYELTSNPISISPSTGTLIPGESQKISVRNLIAFSEPYETTYTSSDPSVAAVSQDGVVTVTRPYQYGSTVSITVAVGPYRTAASFNVLGADSTDQGSCGPGATWSISSDGKYLFIKGSGGTIISMEGKAYSDQEWKKQKLKLRSTVEYLIIEEGIVSIEQDAFQDFTKLKKVVLPNSLQYIGQDAFSGALENLDELHIPGNIHIDTYAFRFAKINKITIGGMATVEGNAFFLSGLNSISFIGAATLKKYAFMSCSYLSRVEVRSLRTYFPNQNAIIFYNTPNATIYAEYDSDAYEYAIKYNIPFVPLHAFKDVVPYADGTLPYYFDSVYWAVDRGITAGTSPTTFSPNKTCTRGQIVTFLWKAMGSPEPSPASNPFTDVKDSDYFYKPVLWAKEKGVTSGTSATTFSPGKACTRGQIMTFLWIALGRPEPASQSNPFTDVSTGDYYYKPVLWAVENGITSGTSATTFSPGKACTRAQAMTFLYKAMS